MSLTPYKGISIARKDMDIIFNLSGYVGLDELNEDDWDKMTDGNEDTGTLITISKSVGIGDDDFIYEMIGELLGAKMDYKIFINKYIPLLKIAYSKYDMNICIDKLIDYYKPC